MGHRYDCSDCGENVDSRSSHEDHCVGSPEDRIAKLERQVTELSDYVLRLMQQVARLEKAAR
jgi:hypothetical protein